MWRPLMPVCSTLPGMTVEYQSIGAATQIFEAQRTAQDVRRTQVYMPFFKF